MSGRLTVLSKRRPAVLNTQAGIGLVEILIAATLGLFILMGVAQGLSIVRDNGRVIDSLSVIQESGRNGLRFLEKDIQLAAFQGCASGKTAEFFAIAQNAPTENLFDSALRGYAVKPTQWVSGNETLGPLSGAEQAIPNSDAITTMRASARGISLARDMSTRDEALVLENNALGIAEGDLVLLSDCYSADLFRVTSAPVANEDGTVTIAHDATENVSENLSKAYPADAQITRFISNTYFVGETSRVDSQGNVVTALYRQPVGGTPIELVEGVENLKILYGERLANDNLRYVEADTNIDWANVLAVRVSLLINGLHLVLSEEDSGRYQLAGNLIGPGDNTGDQAQYPSNRKLRRAFNSTVYIRNRDISL